MNDSAEVGRRLRKVREAKRLTQRALAKIAGLPSSTVSLIESGRGNPSIGSLKRVLDAAGVSFGEFFSLDVEADPEVFFRRGDLVEIGRDGVSFRQVGKSHAGSKLQILHETYQPGADSGRIPLTHEGEEGGVIISGRLEVTVDGTRSVLGPGDAYRFSSLRPHRFRNAGSEPCVIVTACTPPSF
jgi:transcriptional regulator with XRE-family HTH domain